MSTHRTGRPFCALLVVVAVLVSSAACGAPPAPNPTGAPLPAPGSAATPGQTAPAAAAVASPSAPAATLPAAPPAGDTRAPEIGLTPGAAAATATAEITPTAGVAATAPLTATAALAEDRLFAVDLVADAGILQGHARYETEYRDLAPGPASLANGSYLRTLDGEASVLLPGNSVVMMGPHTEVQVGMYDNGILIWQHSGSTFHHVVPREGALYEVATPFLTAVALGTQLRVVEDWPAEGWIMIIDGEVACIRTDPIYDPVTGAVTGYIDVYDFVPESFLLIPPEGYDPREEPPMHFTSEEVDAMVFTLEELEGMVFTEDEVGQVVAQAPAAPPEDGWAASHQALLDEMRRLADDYEAGRLTEAEYRERLLALLNEDHAATAEEPPPEPEPPEPIPPWGVRWGGMTEGGEALTFCLSSGMVGYVQWVANMSCRTLDTGDEFVRTDIYDLFPLYMEVGAGGAFSGEWYYPTDSLHPNTRVTVEGQIGATAGRVTIAALGETSVEACWADGTVFRVSTTGVACNP